MDPQNKAKYRTIELLAEFGDIRSVGLPANLLRGISAYDAVQLVDFLKPHLPELYLTLHHAKGLQLHPRLRGWSQEPQIQEITSYGNTKGSWNHPDWDLNKKIALFEAYIGKSKEYWAEDLIKRHTLAKRIEEDYKFLFDGILKSLRPEVLPEHSLLAASDVFGKLEERRYSDLFEPIEESGYGRGGTLLFRIK